MKKDHNDSFVITGLGMRCAVGQNAIQACAAVRAGIARFRDWPHMGVSLSDEEAAIVGAAVVPDLGDCSWIEKLDDLTTQPLLESLWSADLKCLVDPGEPKRWGVYLSTPPLDRAGVDEEDAEEFLEEVRENTLFPFEPGTISIFSSGHAGVLLALDTAMRDLAEERLDVCVVGGTDSLLESEFLSLLLSEKKLKTEGVPSGIIPGEAAAFVVLEKAEHARGRGVGILACVTPVRTAVESAPACGDAPARAEATKRVLQKALEDAPCEPSAIQRVVNDLNGERWRFLEWAIADARALSKLPQHWRLWHPADCLGDVGASTGAVHLCIATRAFQRGYAVGKAILVCNSSEEGERAATVVFPAERER